MNELEQKVWMENFIKNELTPNAKKRHMYKDVCNLYNLNKKGESEIIEEPKYDTFVSYCIERFCVNHKCFDATTNLGVCISKEMCERNHRYFDSLTEYLDEDGW